MERKSYDKTFKTEAVVLPKRSDGLVAQVAKNLEIRPEPLSLNTLKFSTIARAFTQLLITCLRWLLKIAALLLNISTMP